MSRKPILLVLVCALAGAFPSAALANTKIKPTYYLALGDSLAQGGQPFGPVQPTGMAQTIPTNQGYVNDLYAAEKHKIKGLKLEDLGCLSNPGESTTTMINGGKCSYSAGSQLAQAVRFIHRHTIAFITLDIGANNVDSCVTGGTQINIGCVTAGVAAIQSDVPTILTKLRKAAGNKTKIVGMTYYDPFLAEWLRGSSGQAVATLSVALAKALNGDLVSAFEARDLRVADVATVFGTYVPFSTTTTIASYPSGPVPVAVANVCQWTWMCTGAPQGPNIHGSAAGYREMTAVFKKALG